MAGMRRALAVALAAALCCGCYYDTEAGKTSKELSKQADSFEVTRRITVFNLRTNEVMWQLTGNFSTHRDGEDLDVIVDRGNGLRQKFYFKCGEWVTYLVEDLDNTDWPAYEFDIEIGGE